MTFDPNNPNEVLVHGERYPLVIQTSDGNIKRINIDGKKVTYESITTDADNKIIKDNVFAFEFIPVSTGNGIVAPQVE